MKNEMEPAEAYTPQHFYADMISAFFKAARERGCCTGDDLLAPELMQAGGELTNALLLNERIYEGYQGDDAAYYHDVAKAHLYAGAYYTHAWQRDRESVKHHNFAMKYLRSGIREVAEPYMTLSRQELADFCGHLYALFSEGMTPHLDGPDVDAYLYYGLNAFFVVSVSITAKSLGMEGTPLPADIQHAEAPEQSEDKPPAWPSEPRDRELSPDAGISPAVAAEQARVVAKASAAARRQGREPLQGSAERFRVDLLEAFINAAAEAGYVDKDVAYPEHLVQPGVEFIYTLMSSQPYYESNKHDMVRYYYKMARHGFCAGAYYAYLWDKQSKAYLDNDFHLVLLRAGLRATMEPLMPVNYDEISGFCSWLHLQYMTRIARYRARPDYPVFEANGMHAFYMVGAMAQLKWMRIE